MRDMLQWNAVKMRVVCFVLLIVHCSCSKSGDNSRIPNVGQLITSGGYVGNIGGSIGVNIGANVGGSSLNGGGKISVGNIANIAQSNIGPLRPFGNIVNNGVRGTISGYNLLNLGIGTLGNGGSGAQGNNGGSGSIGNVATAIQTNIDATGSGGSAGSISSSGGVDLSSNVGNLANIGQSNVQGSQGGIGNLATVVQSNIGGTQGSGNVGNIANIGQSNINGINYYYYYGEERNIERPCHVYDTFCIRKYLAEHSKCKEIYGLVSDPIYRAQSTLYLPRINLTITGVDNLYGGLNGRIEEFYINRETDNLVLSVEFRNLTFYSRNAYFRFERRGREPIVTNDYLYINYPSLVTTIIIPNKKDLQLQESEVFTYINVLPTFSIGRNAIISSDLVVAQTFKELLTDQPTDKKEINLTEGRYYVSTFIQNQLCDFGYKVY